MLHRYLIKKMFNKRFSQKTMLKRLFLGLAKLTMAALNRSESDIDMDQSDVRIERPDRTNQMTLNPKQTRRLAAIFGLQ